MAHKIPGGFKGFMVSEGSIALNPKTSMLYCVQAMMAGVAVSTGMAAGALGLILYVYAVLLAVYSLLSPNYLLNNKIGGTTALAAIAQNAGMQKISNFLNRWGFAFLMGDSVITMLITVTAAAATVAYLVLGASAHSESLLVEPTNIRTLITMGGFTLIVLAIRFIQGLGTNRLGFAMSWIALIWTIATLAISVPHMDLSILLAAFNPMNVIAFVTHHPLMAGAVSLAFLAPTGLEMMYADVSHISVANMRKTAATLAVWAVVIYTAQAGFVSTHYAGQVITDFSGMVSEMSLYFAKRISGGNATFANGFAWFMSIMTVLASAAAVQSTNIGAQVLCQESSNSDNLFAITYKYPEGCNAEQGYSPFVADLLTFLGLLLGNGAMIILGAEHAAHLFDNMYGPVILVTMITTAYTFLKLESKYKSSGKWTYFARVLLVLAMIVEGGLLLSNFIKIIYDTTIVVGLVTTLTLSLLIVSVLWMHSLFQKMKNINNISYKELSEELKDDFVEHFDKDSYSIHLLHIIDNNIPTYAINSIRDDLRIGNNVQIWSMNFDNHMDEEDVQEIRMKQLYNDKQFTIYQLSIPTTTPFHMPSLIEKVLPKMQVKTQAYVYSLSDYSKLSLFQLMMMKFMLFMRKKAFYGFQVDKKLPVYIGSHYNPYADYIVAKGE